MNQNGGSGGGMAECISYNNIGQGGVPQIAQEAPLNPAQKLSNSQYRSPPHAGKANEGGRFFDGTPALTEFYADGNPSGSTGLFNGVRGGDSSKLQHRGGINTGGQLRIGGAIAVTTSPSYLGDGRPVEQHDLINDCNQPSVPVKPIIYQMNSLAASFGNVAALNGDEKLVPQSLEDAQRQLVMDGNGKPLRILQRQFPMATVPTAMRAPLERVSQEAPDSMLGSRPRGGHRKKTLSLNPEEREALENLVEEVLIEGFEETAIDSDGSLSSDDERSPPAVNKTTESPRKQSDSNGDTNNSNRDKNRDRGTEHKDAKPSMPNQKGNYALSKENSHRERERQFAREFGRNAVPRNTGKDFTPSGTAGGNAGGGRDYGRRRDNNMNVGNSRMKDNRSKSGDFRQSGGDNGRSGGGGGSEYRYEYRQSGDYRQQQHQHSSGNDFRHQSSDARNSGDVRQAPSSSSTDFKSNKPADDQQSFSSGDDKDKTGGGVRGVNIYPAQLKVAIKHMDSLPPRFLRRLQSGSVRLGGINDPEGLLKSARPSEPTIIESPVKSTISTEESPTSSSEKERGIGSSGGSGKSKQTQLQETKKSIRNLLGDLDQYTDEGLTVMTPVSKEMGIMFPPGVDSMRGVTPLSGQFPPPSSSGVLVPGSYMAMRSPPPPFYAVNRQMGENSGVGGATELQQHRPPMPPPLPLPSHQRVLSCEELEKELLHSGGSNNIMQQYAGPSNPSYPGGDYPPMPGMNSFYKASPATGQQQNAGGSAPAKKIQFSVNAPEFVSSLYGGTSSGSPGVSGAQYAPVDQQLLPQFYQQHPIPPGGGVMPGHQYNVQRNTLPPPPPSQYIDIPGRAGVAGGSQQGHYQLMPYDPSMRNSPRTPTYMMSPRMPSPSIGPNGGAQMMNMMPYPYAVPPYSQQNPSGYAPASQNQFTPPQFTPPIQSFMPPPPPNMGGQSHWMMDGPGAAGVPPPSMTQAVPPPSLEAWYTPTGPASGDQFGTGMYVVGGSGAEQNMMGGDDGSYVIMDRLGGVENSEESVMMGGEAIENGWGGPMYMNAYEAGRQKVMRLLNEGHCVMVILIGGPDGDKMSLVSEMQTSGALVLNMRNGFGAADNMAKMKEIQNWNFKQAVDAVESKKSPIIIDYMYANDMWGMQAYINLGQQHGYVVEVIDSSGSGMREMAEQPINSQYDGYPGQQSTDIYTSHPTMGSADLYQRVSNNPYGPSDLSGNSDAGLFPGGAGMQPMISTGKISGDGGGVPAQQ